MSEKAAVYRLFAADDALLYIGVSKSFGRRWTQHASTKPWWPEVHHQTVEWHPDLPTARAAETAAINSEGSRYNRRKRHPRPADAPADRHLGKAITPRLPGDLRERGRGAAKRAGTTLTAAVVAFVRWYVGDTDELPKRPRKRSE